MTNAATIMTPDNAPRDEVALASEGVFIHRRLAESLFDRGFKIWQTEKEKTAFVTAPGPERARAIVQKLKEMDAASGVKPAAMAAPAPEPAQRAPQTAAAAPAEEPVAKRAPRTSNGNGAAGHSAPAAASPSGGAQDLLLAVRAIADQVKDISAKVNAVDDGQTKMGNALVTQLAILQKENAELKTYLSSVAQVQHVQLGLLCLFGQQVLNAPMPEFIGSALDDAKTALSLLENLGKA
jgi:hypothetical protein